MSMCEKFLIINKNEIKYLNSVSSKMFTMAKEI